MKNKKSKNGFTLVELLVALMVTGIILSAVATLAYALGVSYEASDDTSGKQAQVRTASLRISELIRHAKLICAAPGNDLAIWALDSNADNQINPTELVYIEAGTGRDQLTLLDFSSSNIWAVSLADIRSGSAKTVLISSCQERRTTFIPECNNVEFVGLREPVAESDFVGISFDIEENGETKNYQIAAGLRGWSGNLLNAAGDSLVSDDD